MITRLLEWDRAAYRWLHHEWRPGAETFWKLVTDSGLGEVQIPVLLLLAIPKATRRFALAGLLAFLLSGALRLIFARTISRSRPSNLFDSVPLESTFGDTSFPSGHTTTSFAIAVIVLLMLSGTRKVWIGWLLLAWAVAVGISRVVVGVHWPLDIFGGALFGAAAASGLYLLLLNKGWLGVKEHQAP